MPLHRMIGAELRKVLTRGSGWAGLALSAGFPVLVLALMYYARSQMGGDDASMTINNNPLSQMMAFEVQTALDYALTLRNFIVMKLVILMVTAQLFAGEWSERTLRSLLVRPVPRWGVLTAKTAALWLYAGLCTLITFLLTLLPAMALFDFELEIDQVCLGFLASWAADLGIIALGVAVSTISPSVVGVVVGTIAFVIFEFMFRMGLKGASLVGWDTADAIEPWMPGNALDAWQGYTDGWDTQSLGGLAALVAIALAVAIFRFQRTDVP